MNLEATDRTPAISLTQDPLKLSISGESFPEDVSAFYGDIISAINQLASTAKGKLEVEMAMVYINSSSIKAMYRIFEGLDAYRQAGNEVQVTWKAEADDDIMQELGEDFKDRSLISTIEKNYYWPKAKPFSRLETMRKSKGLLSACLTGFPRWCVKTRI